MEPKIITHDQLNLVGFSFYGDPFRLSPGWTEENEIGRLWARFMAYVQQHREELKALIVNPGIAYEIHIYNEDTMATGLFEVFIGAELAHAELAHPQLTETPHPPIDTVIKVLPATQYAVFTLHGEEIVGDWPLAIYQEWLPNSAYESAHNFHIQFHDGSFKGFDHLDESSLDVYVPIKLRS
jgi:predicted transcriptional regulator YdeE